MKIEQAKQLTDQALDQLIQALEAGKSEVLKAYLATMSRFRRYSWGNLLLIALQMPSASRVAGFHTWRSLGRFVKKGEKGIMILAPIVVKRRADQDVTVAEDGVSAADQALVGFRPVYVWDQSQTDGNPLSEFAEVTGDPGQYSDRLKSYVQQLGIALEFSSDIAPAKGVSHGGKITLLPDLSPAETFSTLVHEVSHELLHRSERRAQTTRTSRETEAEAVAFVVSTAVGLELSTSSSDYIQLWQGDKQLLIESLHFVQQAASQILTAISPGE
ncbi:MAG: ArdC family protein [Acidobacteriota bacterium]